MTAAVIMQLAQEGKLSLDDPVSKYVPGVPNGDNITIAELLEMRSGLYNYTNAPEVSASMDRDPTKVWSPAEVLAIAFARPPTSRPVQPTSTTTPTTRCSASSPKRSMASHWPGDAGPVVRAAGYAAHRAPRQHREHHPRSLLARLPVRQLLGRLGGRTALLARGPGRGQGRNAPAQRLHGPEPFLCRGGRGRHFHRQRSRHLDPGTGCRPRAQRRISAPLARQPASPRTRASPRGKSTGTASAN